MKRLPLIQFTFLAGVIAMPAAAADYYLTSRYMGDTYLGETVLVVDATSITRMDNGNTRAEVVSINAANVIVSVFPAEVDCARHAWRIVGQKDYRTNRLVAPTTEWMPRSEFNEVERGSERGKALDFICGWPGSAAAIPATARFKFDDPIALSEKIVPTLGWGRSSGGSGEN